MKEENLVTDPLQFLILSVTFPVIGVWQTPVIPTHKPCTGEAMVVSRDLLLPERRLGRGVTRRGGPGGAKQVTCLKVQASLKPWHWTPASSLL
jgi:hypothetical protein